MVSITAWHNKVLDRLVKEIKQGEVSIDKVVPDAPGEDCPDIILIYTCEV